MGSMMINLDDLTEHGEVHNLSGHERGLAARRSFGLDRFDIESAEVEIVVPAHIYAVSPSFVQGLLAGSLQNVGYDMARFHARYRLNASDLIKRQFERGYAAIRVDRSFEAD